MTRIGILTWLHNGNYGTVLQAYALQHYLRAQGYEVKHVDFLLRKKDKLVNLIRQRNTPLIILEKLRAVLIGFFCPTKENGKRIPCMEHFLHERLHLTRRYQTIESLDELNEAFDVFISGSDQIWSPLFLSPPYFLNFTHDEKRRIGYACSFGIRAVFSEFKRRKIKGYLERYEAVSVREKSGVQIIRELTGREVPMCVDPSMLLTEGEWEELTAERLVQTDYLFCYFLSYNAAYWEKCIRIAQERGLELVFIPLTLRSYHIQGRRMENVGPEKWLSLVKHATMVATDSFHGCIFSMLFKKNFMVFKRFDDKRETSQNTRVYHLLDTYGLRKCLVEDVDSYIPAPLTPEEYAEVTARITNYATRSKTWLNNAIHGNENH